jgi:hypothetical protein
MSSHVIPQNNDEDHLRELFNDGIISGQEYHFRKKAKELGIQTLTII